jgi:hypothetical protein
MSSEPKRVCFDTTVLWGAFHSPAGPNFLLLELAAQRTPVLAGFIRDAVGAEFWWRATQQGIKGPRDSVARTYTEAELTPVFEAFEVLFEPAAMSRAPLSRALARYARHGGLAARRGPPRNHRPGGTATLYSPAKPLHSR